MIQATDALNANAHMSGTTTRRVYRARLALISVAIDKDVVNRSRRTGKRDRDIWKRRALAELGIVRSIVDGAVARVRFARKANRHAVDPNVLPNTLAATEDTAVSFTAVRDGIESASFQTAFWVKRNVSKTTALANEAAVPSVRWKFAL